MNCPTCGHGVSHREKTCPFCGRPLSSGKDSETPPPPETFRTQNPLSDTPAGSPLPTPTTPSESHSSAEIALDPFTNKYGARPKPETLWDGYTKYWQKYAKIDGRATRRDMWGAFLYNFLFSTGISILFGFLIPVTEDWPTFFFMFVTFCPSLCQDIRRLHDTKRSGHYLWFSLLPIIGWIYIIYLLYFAPSVD